MLKTFFGWLGSEILREQHWSFQIEKNKEDFLQKLRNNIVQVPNFIYPPSFYHKRRSCVYGKISNSSLKLKIKPSIAYYRDILSTHNMHIFRGRFQQQDGKTLLLGEYRFVGSFRLFYLLWITLVICFMLLSAILLLVNVIPNEFGSLQRAFHSFLMLSVGSFLLLIAYVSGRIVEFLNTPSRQELFNFITKTAK